MRIKKLEHPKPKTVAYIRQGILDFNDSIIQEQPKSWAIEATQDSKTIAGALCFEHSDAIYIDVLWVEAQHRGQNIGNQIMSKIENSANKTNIKKLFVDTFDFQAKGFYEKLGFKIIGTIPDYLRGHSRHYLRKDL